MLQTSPFINRALSALSTPPVSTTRKNETERKKKAQISIDGANCQSRSAVKTKHARQPLGAGGGYGSTCRPTPPPLLSNSNYSPPLLLSPLPLLLLLLASSPRPPPRRPCPQARLRRWQHQQHGPARRVAKGAVPELHHLDMERDARELPGQGGGPARAARPRLRRLRRALAQVSERAQPARSGRRSLPVNIRSCKLKTPSLVFFACTS